MKIKRPSSRPFTVYYSERVGSTNDEAIALLQRGESEKFVVWADEQTKGRGRRGRRWESPQGNLYCSLVLPLNKETGQIPFVISLALLEALSGHGIKNISLKWPNDVLIEGRKVAGILLEREGEKIVIGLGVNVEKVPENTIYPTSCLKEYIQISVLDILLSFLEKVEFFSKKWEEEGFAEIRRLWLQHVIGLDQEIVVRMPNETKTGIFRGLFEDGRLVLEEENSKKSLISVGDVYFPRS